jgi:hypothetical protein
MITTYKKYIASGLACLPTGDDKMPAIPKGATWKGGWNGEQEYMTSFGIALVGGSASGGLECIDFDNHFGDAKEVVSEFYKMEGIKDIITSHNLPVESTTSGGFHLIYRCEAVGGNQKLASRPRYDEATKKERPDVLIETRGEGGYFVVAPTPGYKIFKGDLLKIETISAEERDIIIPACRTFNKNAKVIAKPEEEKDRAGDIYNRSAEAVDDMISALKSDGWTELKEGIWRRPGKKKGISATLGRVAPGIFYNFSSSAAPFESERAYTPFHVVTLLKYNGDFKQFAKELYEKYAPQVEAQKEARKEDQLNNILSKAYINLEIPVAKPPVIMRIKSRDGSGYRYNRVFTLGNFSSITGKSKSKKTFLTSLFLAASTVNGYFDKIFYAEIPANKPGVVLFDTEQSPYDAYITAKRVWELGKGVYPNFGAFDLREFTPFQRCDIIEKYLIKAGDQTSFIVIDGIADLANAINDEVEASRVVSLLMKWTKTYNVHICTVIHQNKNDNYATGHLGSSILKKAECIISVRKDDTDNTRSEVNCENIRGTSEFDSFYFKVNDNGLPETEFANSVQMLEAPFIKSI